MRSGREVQPSDRSLNSLFRNEIEADRGAPMREGAEVLVGVRPIRATADLENMLRPVDSRKIEPLRADRPVFDPRHRYRRRKLVLDLASVETDGHDDSPTAMKMNMSPISDAAAIDGRVHLERLLLVLEKHQPRGV